MFLGIADFWGMTLRELRFAYLIMTNCSFARFARTQAFSMFVQFMAVLILSTTWNDMSFCVDDVATWQQSVFLYSSLIPEHLEHILHAWLAKLHFQMHDILALIIVVFAYIKLPKIFFGADRVWWGLKWFGMKSKYSSQGMHTIFILRVNVPICRFAVLLRILFFSFSA